MTTSSPLARIGPVTWLVLQGAATVASILLAFGIDAWWDQRNEAAEKNAMLESAKAEMLSDLDWVQEECAYRRASIDSVKVLLNAAGVGRYEDTEKTLDHRLGDLLFYSHLRFSTGAVDGLLSSGRVAAIEDTKLRALLLEYPRTVEDISGLGRRDQATMLEVVAPFLSRNASLLQISNESYRNGQPGDGAYADPTGLVPLAATNDHTPLLSNLEFAGVVTRKMWTDIRVRDELCNDMTKGIDEMVRLIDQELRRTS